MRMKCISLGVLFLLPGLLPAQETQFDEVIDSPMYKSPVLPVPGEVMVFPDKAKDLWLRALERPEADMRYKAAEAIALAHQAGMKGLKTTIVALRTALDRPEPDPTVRLAMAEALVALGAREAAASLLAQAKKGGVELRNVIEPALARWDYEPARALWLERVRDQKTPSRSLVLAIRGLAAAREDRAIEPLRQIVLADQISGTIRIEAARGLGALRKSGLEKDAELLSADTSRPNLAKRLAAVALLRQHRGDRTVAILRRLETDREPAVAGAAFTRLLEIDPALVVPMIERFLGHADPKLRMHALEALLRRPGPNGMRLLSDRLGDLHRDVRSQARRSLRELAMKPEFRDTVVTQATRILATPPWQALEQATILLAQLGHKPAAARFVELLTFDRAEVCVTAAWGLRKLSVPETLPAAMRHADAQRQRLLAGKQLAHPALAPHIIDHQLAQINQFLGAHRFAEADPVLRRYIANPGKKYPRLAEARAAAIWALGLIHAGKPVPELARALEDRLAPMELVPEDERVRAMSAISLGRMKAMAQLATLRRFCPDQQAGEGRLRNACGWAIEQLTGEPLKAPLTLPRGIRWFLMPNE